MIGERNIEHFAKMAYCYENIIGFPVDQNIAYNNGVSQ